MADETELVERAKALREECRRGVEDRKVMPDYVDACVALKALAPKLLDTIEALQRERDRLRAAGWAAVRANTAARNMVPDDDEGLAAKVFCYHINVADNELRAALSGEAS